MSIVIRPQVNINAAGVTMRINKAVRDTVPGLTTDIRKDCNQYAPHRQGFLRDLDETHGNVTETIQGNKGTIKWGVIYASYVYKGISKKNKKLKYSKHPNAKARAKWAEYAKRMHLVQWRDMLEARAKANYNGQ